jgi:hypothetical protein
VKNSGIYTSTNAGMTWTAQTNAPSAASTGFGPAVASSSDGSHLVVAIWFGDIYISTNAGMTWTETSAPVGEWWSVASSSDGIHLFAAVGDPGGIYISTNSGETWTQTSAPSSSYWQAVASSSDGSHLVAVENGGGIYASANSGETWTEQMNAPGANWSSVASSSDGSHLVAVVGGGGIYTSPSIVSSTGAPGTGASLQYVGNGAWQTVTFNDAQLPADVALLDAASQTFTGQINFIDNNVGIGTNNPAATLEVNGTAQIDGAANLYGGIYMNSANGFHQSSLGPFYVDASGDLGGRFTVTTNGSVGINNSSPNYLLDVNGNIGLEGTHLIYNSVNAVIDWGSGDLYFRRDTTQGNINTYVNLMILNSAGDLSITGTLSQGSDRNSKQDFAPVNPQDVLAKVASLPIEQWQYKADPGVRHLGPMSQDFHAAFGLNGADDRRIATVDEEGVALAAIQGLNQKLEAETKEKDAEIQTLKQQNDSLAARLNELEAAVRQLAARK